MENINKNYKSIPLHSTELEELKGGFLVPGNYWRLTILYVKAANAVAKYVNNLINKD